MKIEAIKTKDIPNFQKKLSVGYRDIIAMLKPRTGVKLSLNGQSLNSVKVQVYQASYKAKKKVSINQDPDNKKVLYVSLRG